MPPWLAPASNLLIGRLSTAILANSAEPGRSWCRLAILIGGSIALLRGLLQFGRNFGAELMAQRIERDVRDELYISLLGKSMTFHSLQPVGDTMARATNDVREVNYHVQPGGQPGDGLAQLS